MRIGILWLLVVASASLAQRQPLQPDCACDSKVALSANREGLEAHLKRRLTEASEAYDRVLAADPASEPSRQQTALLERFAPRLYVTSTEPFPLPDFAAVLHPKAAWIAYHLFWEDDIDFPDDNDPCDHEVLWVRLDGARVKVLDIYTYFHGRILHAPPIAVDDANKHGGRAKIHVQWGKHGSMPVGWEKLEIIPDPGDIEGTRMPHTRITLEAYHRATFEKLSTEGRRAQQSPLGRG